MRTIKLLSLGFLFIGSGALAQETEKNEVKKDSVKTLNEVIINGNVNKFKKDSNPTVSKMPLKDLENPQVYNSISGELLKEQVVTNFNDGMKNATGVTRLWESTGRAGDGAEFYSMRGFAVQPTMVNGLPALNNGTIDPSHIESIDVIKGPSGTLFGSSVISYGGLINITTKKPYKDFGAEVTYNPSTYNQDRVTADLNTPLNARKNVLLRISTAYQKGNTFQDHGFGESFFVAPSFTYEANDRLTFLVNTQITNREAANAPMIFLSRFVPLSFHSMDLFEKNYKNSFTSNDLSIKNPTYSGQFQTLYKLSKSWTSQTVISGSKSKTDGYYSYLWDDSNGDSFTRKISKADGNTATIDIQQNFIGDFKIGNMPNKIVAGLDYYNSKIENNGTDWLNHGTVSLANGTDTGDLSLEAVNTKLAGTSYISNAKSTAYSAYVSDVIHFLPQLSAMASVRVDYFEGKVKSPYEDSENKGQTAVSPKLGLVYQPIKDRVSVFANYMNGFVNVSPKSVTDIDGSNPRMKSFDPEHANQVEFGVKTNLYKNRISATASYYNINVTNRVMADPTNPNNSIQGAEVVSRGVEVSVIANPINGMNIVAGFSNNHSEVKKDNPASGYLGMRPEEAGPETVANLWASYTITYGKLKGLGFGLGGNHASEHKTLNRANTGTFTLPSYSIANSAITYTNNRFNVALKLNNIFNEKYYTGWSTVTPQALRTLTAGITYKI
ncbi:putative TonB-dependent receptor [Flavobacterium enshiense DK69]|uniref:TonB-dependent siderophore receptor n=1 Tax=Flavobacterium enshiense TaxID=1341165 RepID=UPI0003C57D5F|nr:TonB-dependent siderophore receptor [Flavobacterium enshiense]ESU22745.1 putative TonB-dependent receptor [Flavobacterium enshiense DK69]